MRILNVGQVCDLENGGFSNQMSVQLRDGRVVVITTDESTVAQLIDAAAAELKGTPINTVSVATTEEPPPPPALEPPAEGTEFGGDVPDPGETSDVPVPPPTGTLDVAPAPEPEYPRDKLGRPIKRGPDRRSALGAGHPNKKGRVDPYRTVDSVPARTVPHDEAGNPLVPQTRAPVEAAAPAEDEDGTSI